MRLVKEGSAQGAHNSSRIAGTKGVNANDRTLRVGIKIVTYFTRKRVARIRAQPRHNPFGITSKAGGQSRDCGFGLAIVDRRPWQQQRGQARLQRQSGSRAEARKNEREVSGIKPTECVANPPGRHLFLETHLVGEFIVGTLPSDTQRVRG